MSADLHGKVAIVTGAGGGIGRATAFQLAEQGASVVVNDIGTSTEGLGDDFSKANAVADEIRAAGGKAAPNHDSVSDFDAAANIVATALREFGGVAICRSLASASRRRRFVASGTCWRIVTVRSGMPASSRERWEQTTRRPSAISTC